MKNLKFIETLKNLVEALDAMTDKRLDSCKYDRNFGNWNCALGVLAKYISFVNYLSDKNLGPKSLLKKCQINDNIIDEIYNSSEVLFIEEFYRAIEFLELDSEIGFSDHSLPDPENKPSTSRWKYMRNWASRRIKELS